MNNINKEIGLRIAAARKNKGITATELAEKSGFSSGRISHWEQGRRLPNLDSVLILQEILETPAAYLLCIEPKTYPGSYKISDNTIPLYNIPEIANDKPHDSITLFLPFDLEYKDLFAIKLLDESMETLFRKNDLVIFNRKKECVDGSFVLFSINKTGQILFRKFVIDNTNINEPLFKFIPLNANFETITTPNSDSFSILGVYNDTARLFV